MNMQPSTIQQDVSGLSMILRKALRIAGSVTGWIVLLFFSLLAAFASGWVYLAASRMAGAPQTKVLILWLVVMVLTAGTGWLVSRTVLPARIVGLALGTIFVVGLAAWVIWGACNPDSALFLAREIAWGDSAVTDYLRFPQRTIRNAAPAYRFRESFSPEYFQTVEYQSEGATKTSAFEAFLQDTHTTSFLIIRDDTILLEGYYNGYGRDSIVTSFSMAKSFTSALVGIAIHEGYIGSVEDRMTAYLPELAGRGFDQVTIRDLLEMSAGIRYRTDDEFPPLEELSQFTDDGMTYAHPNLRRLALEIQPDGAAPGTEFNYNNYHPLLLGMILERTTGRTPSAYLEEKIWMRLGMEYPASWSLDSNEDSFELMQSGINARAIDFAKFGRLFLNEGDWNGTQVIPRQWILDSTSPDPDDKRAWRSDPDWKEMGGFYRYMWWGRSRTEGNYEFMAQGHLGQWIFISPKEQVVIVRFGLDDGEVDSWPDVFRNILAGMS